MATSTLLGTWRSLPSGVGAGEVSRWIPRRMAVTGGGKRCCGGEAGSRSRLGFGLDASHDPAFELFAPAVGDLHELDSGSAPAVSPGDFALGFQPGSSAGQKELRLRNGVPGELTFEANRHAPFAQIGDGAFEFLTLVEEKVNWNLNRAAEVAALFADHEAEGGVEAAQGAGGGDGFLQNKVCTQLERFLDGGPSVQNRARDRRLVAGRPAQITENIDAPRKIVAVDQDRIERRCEENFGSRLGRGGDFDSDRKPFERRPENADHVCVATDEQGLEVHGP